MHLFALLLLLGQAPQDAQPQKSSDYNLEVHVQSSRLEKECQTLKGDSLCNLAQHLTVRISGRQYELARSNSSTVFRIGDYKARVVSEKTDGREQYNRTYEILLANGKPVRFSVIGESE